ncbi:MULTISPECIES: hypothetical protein [Nocardioides]|uniref:Uncharacterized protein n=1 Tax=Nocardioides vastitatis TaxID=2568655 RepID=A0ABW0ZH87_9ACTN|nr:hypothetical protein [Nocardioides sp.]
MFTTASSRPTHADATEWGPAKHDPDHPLRRASADKIALFAVDLRDGDDRRPDDN